MSKINFFKITLIVLFFLTIASANDAEIKTIFKTKGVNGTLIISSLNGDYNYIYNKKRSIKQYLPASTFKLPNTLIALDENIIEDENEIIKWDGKKRTYDAWNKDQSLKSALPVSCVWAYQKLSKEIGNKNYIKHLQKINYGNKKTGPNLTTFWLDGDLKISASQQIEFLKKLYNYELPYKKKYINILKDIMIITNKPTYIIRAKTGLSSKIAWYVGYVESKNKVWFFALNIDINKRNDIEYRKEIVMQALRVKNII